MDARRDWGYAKDYVEAMWMMLQAPSPDDYIVATGENHSVREFCEVAFKEVGIDIEWQGEGIEEKGIDKKTNKVVIDIDPQYFRPVEVESLLGDNSKIRENLGWNPKTSFSELVKLMIESDLNEIR